MRITTLALVLLLGTLFFAAAASPDGSGGKAAGKEPPKPVAGVGLVLSMPGEKLTIVKVLPGTPAAEAGLTERLVIQTIDGVPTAGRSQSECGALIRGLPGTRVRLDLIDPARGKAISVELTRRWVR